MHGFIRVLGFAFSPLLLAGLCQGVLHDLSLSPAEGLYLARSLKGDEDLKLAILRRFEAAAEIKAALTPYVATLWSLYENEELEMNIPAGQQIWFGTFEHEEITDLLAAYKVSEAKVQKLAARPSGPLRSLFRSSQKLEEEVEAIFLEDVYKWLRGAAPVAGEPLYYFTTIENKSVLVLMSRDAIGELKMDIVVWNSEWRDFVSPLGH
jgi:hypothetical protein